MTWIVIVAVVAVVLLGILLVASEASRRSYIQEADQCKGLVHYWKASAERKDVEIFELRRDMGLLREWIRKKWGGNESE